MALYVSGAGERKKLLDVSLRTLTVVPQAGDYQERGPQEKMGPADGHQVDTRKLCDFLQGVFLSGPWFTYQQETVLPRDTMRVAWEGLCERSL